jgi:hypothetical protein
MAITYGFFDARQSTGGTYDRVYTAEQMSKYFKGIFTDGVLMNVGQTLAVTASSGMVVQIGTGRAFLDSRWMENDSVADLTVSDAHAILNRKDIVVARLDYDARLIELAIKTGTAASAPVAPAVTRNAAYYELELAEIDIAAGTTEITQAMITDKRSDQSVCGYVTGAVTQIDTATFWTQLQDAFLTWFDEMKGQLDEDAAGHLQLEINDILGNFATWELTTTASKSYHVGECLVLNRKLYEATAEIDQGDTLSIGTNIEQTNVGAKVANRRLWFKDVAVSAITGSIIDLQDSRITADYVLEGGVITWGDSSKITSLTSWSTETAGHFIVTGTASAATTATFALVKADQRIENNS